MDKHKVSVHTVGPLFGLKKEKHSCLHGWVGREDARLSEINQTQKSIPGSESREWVPGLRRQG